MIMHRNKQSPSLRGTGFLHESLSQVWLISAALATMSVVSWALTELEHFRSRVWWLAGDQLKQ